LSIHEFQILYWRPLKMTKLTIRSQFTPPPWLSAAHVPAFESLCDRLQSSGADLSETDLLTVGRLAISEADLLQAERIAADCPMTVESKSNGELPHPIFKRIRELRAEVRSWMRLLPRAGSGGRIPLPHVSPAGAAVAAAAAGDAVAAAGDAVAAAGGAAGGAGEPSENLKRLRQLIREFQAGQTAGSGAAGGAAAAGVGGCVDAAGDAAE
jgi:hypothetical protein